ncbi:hypothetical protein DL89DRAFT_297225 [Linderina pennispora]|uniref:Uncharacterized protein n=1 Tax=Linderina pennispora TaxID=61395 RepID=A0A1Y1VTG0_9FUNG|nr:uncharacterized protein DL89DRAFT_297225 [Linderina pennispora]ORX64577.1 hypothetical protein DL89DRAFT_297225 [Linderina pennispora]
MQFTTVLALLFTTVSALPALEIGTLLLNQELAERTAIANREALLRDFLNRDDTLGSDLILANKHGLTGNAVGITNEQAVTIQNQLIAQRNLEAPAAQHAVATFAAQPVVVQTHAPAPIVVQTHAPAPIVVQTQEAAPVFQVPETAAIIVDTKPHAKSARPVYRHLALHTAIAL